MGPVSPEGRSGAGFAVFLVQLLSVLGSVFHLLFLYCFSTVSTVNSRFFCFFTCTFFFTHLALPEAEPHHAKSKKCVTVKTLETGRIFYFKDAFLRRLKRLYSHALFGFSIGGLCLRQSQVCKKKSASQKAKKLTVYSRNSRKTVEKLNNSISNT